MDYQEIYRYLGYGKNTPDASTKKLVKECVAELTLAAAPKSIWQPFDLSASASGGLLFAGMQVESKNLARNLTGCGRIILFAATLGASVDILLQRYTRLQMSKAVVMQAVAAAMIEEYCDRVNEEIKQEFEAKGLFLRPRFSPGYGDFSLAHQPALIRILQCPKKIGLTLMDSGIMAPSKSVTAVIGVSERKEACHIKGCEVCEKTDCAYRRS